MTSADCVACRTEISVNGVECLACDAPHHAACFQRLGRCLTCSCPKPPKPFGPTASASYFQSPAFVVNLCKGLAIAAIPSMALVYWSDARKYTGSRPPPPPSTAPMPVRPIQSGSPWPASVNGHAWPPGLPQEPRWRPPGQDPAFWSGSGDPSPMGAGPGRPREEYLRLLDRSLQADPLANRRPPRRPHAIAQTQRVEGRLLTAHLPDGVAVPRTRTIFIKADATAQSADAPTVEIAAEATMALGSSWTQLGKRTAPQVGSRWYRFDSPTPFKHFRLKLSDGNRHGLALSTFVVLVPDRPAGLVVLPGPPLTVKAFQGDQVLLTTAAGREVSVPRVLINRAEASLSVPLIKPDGHVVARQQRDGDLRIRASGSGTVRTTLLPLSQLKDITSTAWPCTVDDELWIDGIAAWTLLRDWQPGDIVDSVYSHAHRCALSLNTDGSISAYSAIPGRLGGFDGFDNLEQLENTVEACTREPGLRAESRPYSHLAIQALQLPTSPAAPRTPEELNRLAMLSFLKDKVLPRFAQARRPAPFAAGDTVRLVPFVPSGKVPVVLLTVSTADADTLRVRCLSHAALGEITLPRELLPASPLPSPGDTLALELTSAR